MKKYNKQKMYQSSNVIINSLYNNDWDYNSAYEFIVNGVSEIVKDINHDVPNKIDQILYNEFLQGLTLDEIRNNLDKTDGNDVIIWGNFSETLTNKGVLK